MRDFLEASQEASNHFDSGYPARGPTLRIKLTDSSSGDLLGEMCQPPVNRNPLGADLICVGLSSRPDPILFSVRARKEEQGPCPVRLWVRVRHLISLVKPEGSVKKGPKFLSIWESSVLKKETCTQKGPLGLAPSLRWEGPSATEEIRRGS